MGELIILQSLRMRGSGCQNSSLLSLREDGIRALDTDEIICAERSSHRSSTQVFVFVFTQSGNGLGKSNRIQKELKGKKVPSSKSFTDNKPHSPMFTCSLKSQYLLFVSGYSQHSVCWTSSCMCWTVLEGRTEASKGASSLAH